MTDSSPGSVTEAPVPTGRAPRRVSIAPRGPWRALLVLVLTTLAGLTLVSPASAHEASDPETVAVLDKISPEMPGVTLTVQTTGLGSQFVLENPTPTEVTILSSAGDPLFRIGPDGVLGNFRSPEWYTSKVPGGAVTIPPKATEQGPPVWARVSKTPEWGWFDHRLHGAQLTPEQKLETAPLTPFGNWTVPIKFGEVLGSVEGHLEYRPRLGQFAPSLSDTTPAPGVTLTALSGNPTPGIAISNTGPSEVIVLGDEQEPYLRVSQNGAEANGSSKTWIRSQDPSAIAGDGADPSAAPTWVAVGANGQYAFTMERASPDRSLPELYKVKSETVVRDWTLSLVIDGKRVDIAGQTTLIPPGSGGFWGFWTIAGAVLLALALAAAAVWFLRRRKKGTPPSGGQTQPRREPVSTSS